MFTLRNLLGLSLVFLVASSVVGFLNKREASRLRVALASAKSSQETASRSWMETQTKLNAREKDLSGLKSKVATAEARIDSAETDLKQSQGTSAELKSKLEAREKEVADLRQRVASAKSAEMPDQKESSLAAKLKVELDETKRGMGKLEQEKSELEKKLRVAQDRVSEIEKGKDRRRAHANLVGIHGTVLAVNQAYNFVVLSIGERQGVVPNAEMLVMRAGTLIGRIRISSVEPTTSIGDIITNSLARGVQVQPGDTVIYAGNASS